MRSLLPSVALLLLFPSPVMASPEAANWMGVGVGVGSSRIAPASGIPITSQYGHRLGDSKAWFTLVGDVTLNEARPYGMLMKGSAVGLAAGVQWHSGPLERAHVFAGATAGPRVYGEPGIGVVAQAVLGVVFPVHERVAIALQWRGGVGVARVGDESPKIQNDVIIDATAGVRLNF